MSSFQPQSSFNVDIFDDFDDPTNMESTFCNQVSEQQYQEEIQLETDKALGELCFYLDKNPEAYARVLRRRKQEEIESSGMYSYFKSKMMNLVKGEKYQEELVSSFECIEHVELLKAGMCKTFQYSQELKGNVTRHSERLAAKRKAQPFLNVEGNKRRRVNDSKCSADSCVRKAPCTSNSLLTNDRQCTALDVTVPSGASNDQILGELQPRSPAKDAHNHCESLDRKVESVAQLDSLEQGQKSESKDVKSSDASSIALPPPPPPLPANFVNCFVPCERYIDSTPLKAVTNTKAKTSMSVDDLSVQKLRHKHFSPRANSIPRSKSRSSLYGSVENLSANSGSVGSLDSQFVTPTEGTSVPRLNKQLRSSKSSTSTSNSAIQSEIVSFNSLKRLKATQVNRSPGLTPLRARSDILPSEPLQRALHTAMRRKFKNLTTPSPKSDNSSMNSSFNSVYSSP